MRWFKSAPIQLNVLDRIGQDALIISRLAAAAKKQGYHVKELVGSGGYGLVFTLSASPYPGCVLKIPWVSPENYRVYPRVHPTGYGPSQIVQHGGATGPMGPAGIKTLAEAETLLQEVCERQAKLGPECPLARLYATPRFAGHLTACFEHLEGPDLRWFLQFEPGEAPAQIPAIAEALQTLHMTFGPHGDLKPAHIFLTPQGARFIDPVLQPWVGSVGYSLPVSEMVFGKQLADMTKEHVDEYRYVGDLAALVAILVEVWGGNLGWDDMLGVNAANWGNGSRFGGNGPEAAFTEGEERIQVLPPALRGWALSVLEIFFAQTSVTILKAGWCQRKLQELRELRFTD